jgi:TRAP transporter 4TM/12TM fusion protein
VADGAATAPVAPAVEGEAPTRDGGPLARLLAIALALGAVYWTLGVVDPLAYRAAFLLVALALIFLLFPSPRRDGARRPAARDWGLVLASVAALGWPIADLARFPYRAASPEPVDLALGAAAVLLVLEATRRATGWVLPVTGAAFLLYAYLGPLLDLVGLGLLAHRGYYPDRLIGALYMSLEGIFGVPLDVASTYIALFAVYGAVLDRGGAGRFFVEWALAAMGRRGAAAAPGRAVTVASLLLGTVSGSGVATTVTVGSVGWPMLRRAGYPPDTAGAILAAGGIGALLCPPTLGAAAFLIAEFLQIGYAEVLRMAVGPAVLYYAAVLLMIEADTRRHGVGGGAAATASAWALLRAGWHHFVSLGVVVALLAAGMSAFRAVLWATGVAVALSFVAAGRGARGDARGDARGEGAVRTALTAPRLLDALGAAGRSMLPVVATTATAGIVVGVVTLTGLGLKVAGVLVGLAGGVRALTVVYAAVAVWVLGLAVPVTASYVIAAVMVAPALVQVGVPDYAAHMFVFYYAVLSEVSPPTALAPFAAAALTGGNPGRTMLLTWKYTLPAFLVPLAFTLDPSGAGLLLRAPAAEVAVAFVTGLAGVAALAAGLGGWIRRPAAFGERVAATAAGLLLVAPTAWADAAGALLFGGTVAAHLARTRRAA